MGRSRFTEEQIIGILREKEGGMTIADVCRRQGISATFFKWKAKFGGMGASDARKLTALEDENAKLKKLLADAMLDNLILKDLNSKKMVTPPVRREAVAHLVEHHEVSQQRACRVIAGARSSARYQRRPADDAVSRTRLREIADERRWFGYRRLHQMLKREGTIMNLKKVRRLYAEERLQVRQRNGKLRDELLSEALFSSLAEARIMLTAWKHDYNTANPHSRLGWLTPSEFARTASSMQAMATGAAYTEGSAPMAIASHAHKGNHDTEALLKTGS